MNDDDITHVNGTGGTLRGAKVAMLLPQLKEVFQPPPPPEVVQCLIEVSHPLCEVIVAGGRIILLIVIAKRRVRQT